MVNTIVISRSNLKFPALNLPKLDAFDLNLPNLRLFDLNLPSFILIYLNLTNSK